MAEPNRIPGKINLSGPSGEFPGKKRQEGFIQSTLGLSRVVVTGHQLLQGSGGQNLNGEERSTWWDFVPRLMFRQRRWGALNDDRQNLSA